MTNVLRLQQLIKLLDVTRLQDDDTLESFDGWLESLPAVSSAAYCVYPQFLSSLLKWQNRQPAMALATVVNFPSGDLPVDIVCEQVQQAIVAGATEIDCVLPYKALLRGEYGYVKSFLYDVRQVSADCCLKIIIESGELITAQQVAKATELVIECGANFVKSSTGKTPVGITEEAARIMLTVIHASSLNVGFKASGGVRNVEQALALVQMYEDITGKIATNAGMRIGASVLLTELSQKLIAVE